MDSYGRTDTVAMLKALHGVIFERNEAGVRSRDQALRPLVHKLIAAVEAADLYAAAPSPERLALLNETLDALPQRIVPGGERRQRYGMSIEQIADFNRTFGDEGNSGK